MKKLDLGKVGQKAPGWLHAVSKIAVAIYGISCVGFITCCILDAQQLGMLLVYVWAITLFPFLLSILFKMGFFKDPAVMRFLSLDRTVIPREAKSAEAKPTEAKHSEIKPQQLPRQVCQDYSGKPILDDVTFIQDMHHATGEVWHQYDLLLAARGYGWDMMLDWADYMCRADLENVSQVTAGAFGQQEKDVTQSFHDSADQCSRTPELKAETGMLSVAGISKVLAAPVKIVWINQTRRLRIFTTQADKELVTRYAETVIRRTFGTEDAMKLAKPIPPQKPAEKKAAEKKTPEKTAPKPAQKKSVEKKEWKPDFVEKPDMIQKVAACALKIHSVPDHTCLHRLFEVESKSWEYVDSVALDVRSGELYYLHDVVRHVGGAYGSELFTRKITYDEVRSFAAKANQGAAYKDLNEKTWKEYIPDNVKLPAEPKPEQIQGIPLAEKDWKLWEFYYELHNVHAHSITYLRKTTAGYRVFHISATGWNYGLSFRFDRTEDMICDVLFSKKYGWEYDAYDRLLSTAEVQYIMAKANEADTGEAGFLAPKVVCYQAWKNSKKNETWEYSKKWSNFESLLRKIAKNGTNLGQRERS